jgi:hypothetical protein
MYKPGFAQQAAKACQAGFTDRELADLLGVSEVTLNNWKLEHKEFSLALKAGKAPADDRIERSLFHRAVGYSFDTEKIFCNKDGQITRAETREHVPPDTTAAIFWLKNRRPASWRDRHEISGDPDNPLRVFHAVEIVVTGDRRSWEQVADSRRPGLRAPDKAD